MTDVPDRARASGAWPRRVLRHHLPLAIASAAVVLLWVGLPSFQASGHQTSQLTQAAAHQGTSHAAAHQAPMPSAAPSHPGDAGGASGEQQLRQDRAFMSRLTTATGYVATALLTLTLLIGPANLVLRRRNPISSYLRRDVGAWTAIVSVVHVIVGLQVHGPPAPAVDRIRAYFFASDGDPLVNSFGLGNWTGLAATTVVLALLAISNDLALRTLKAGPWKWIQRCNYALFALVVAHAIYYGALLRVTSVSTLLLGLSVSAVFVGQMVGIRLYRRRYARRSDTA